MDVPCSRLVLLVSIYEMGRHRFLRETVDELYSKVELLNASESFSVGDVATIRVDLYDGYGRTRTKGGDDVRLVVHSEQNNYLSLLCG